MAISVAGPTVDVCVALHNFLLTHQGVQYGGTEEERQEIVALFRAEQERILRDLDNGPGPVLPVLHTDTQRRKFGERKRMHMADTLYQHPRFGNGISIPRREIFGPPRRLQGEEQPPPE
jgi:hypothetical protein